MGVKLDSGTSYEGEIKLGFVDGDNAWSGTRVTLALQSLDLVWSLGETLTSALGFKWLEVLV